MAQVFPSDIDGDFGSLASETLASTLRALPDPWTLLRDRRMCASRLPVDLVLVHPAIGVALLCAAPRDLAPDIAALRDLLEQERFADFFPGGLPLVALSGGEFGALEQRLAGAFDAAAPLAIADPDWAYAVIELLLRPDAAAVAPSDAGGVPCIVPDFAGPRRSLVPTPRIGVVPMLAGEVYVTAAAFRRTASDAPIARRRWIAPAALAVNAVGVVGVVLALLAARAPAISDAAIAPPAEGTAPVAPAQLAEPAVIETSPVSPAAPAPLIEPALPVADSPAAVRHTRRLARHVRCADWLHQDRPGGSDYYGPSVAGCNRWWR